MSFNPLATESVVVKSGKPPKVSQARQDFADALMASRKERGFNTAYGFFHKMGGHANFGFSYKHYLLIESGCRLPSQEGFGRIIEGLGLQSTAFANERRALVRAFLKALVDNNPLFDIVLNESQPSVAAEAAKLEDQLLDITARKALSDVPRMSTSQMELLTSDPMAFWIFNWLAQTRQSLTVEGLCRDLNVDAIENVERSLQALMAADLVQLSEGKYSTRFAQTDLHMPSTNAFVEKSAWIASQIDKRAMKQDPHRYYSYLLLPADNAQRITMIQEIFKDAIRKQYLLRPKHKVEKGMLVAVEASVRSLLPIDEK